MVDQISKPPLLYVWGAPTIDWLNILDYSSHEGLSYWPLSRPQAEVHLTAQPGGSALLHLLLKKMIPSDAFTGDKKAEIKGTQFDNQAIETFEAIKRNGGKLEGPFHPFNSQARHNWTMWQKVSTDGSTTGDKQPRYTMVGWNDREIGAPECNDVMPCMEELSSDCSILFLLDDPDWGQEEDEEKYKGVQEALKNALQVVQNGESVQWAGFNYPPGIILKVSSYNNPSGTITQSAIYQMLLNSPALAQKTTLLTTVRDLRAEGARIGHSLSWERMLDDVVQAVDDCFKQRFGRVIVNVGLCGAVIVEEDSEARMRALIFTRSEQEDDEPQDVLGQSTCMMAALATAWAEYGDKMDWAKATCNGLRMIRSLHDTGYSVSYKSKNRRVLEFPIEDLCNQYYNYPPPMQVDLPNSSFPNADVEGDTEEIGTFITDAVQMQSTRGHTWTILHSELRKKRPAGDARDAARGARQEEQRIFYDIAMNVAKKGPKKALKNVPIEIVGQWCSIDRHEIEGMRSVRNAMRLYINGSESKPLCLAVFGPPGAGKSFAVKQIAEQLKIPEKNQLTFNLSQFEHPSELARAFHQVRDIQLRDHTVPLVFWDEFDSHCEKEPLGWLRYFLMPMEDGVFLESGVRHSVGRGIYVFAGGTSVSYQKFTQCDDERERSAKKPDFISRLRAFIDVKGTDCTPDWSHDRFYMIWRALLLHSFLESRAKGLKQNGAYIIDDGALRAVLQTHKYYHSARSMKSVVHLSDFRGKTQFERSSLPPEHLLQMHVDVDNFMRLVTRG